MYLSTTIDLSVHLHICLTRLSSCPSIHLSDLAFASPTQVCSDVCYRLMSAATSRAKKEKEKKRREAVWRVKQQLFWSPNSLKMSLRTRKLFCLPATPNKRSIRRPPPKTHCCKDKHSRPARIPTRLPLFNPNYNIPPGDVGPLTDKRFSHPCIPIYLHSSSRYVTFKTTV